MPTRLAVTPRNDINRCKHKHTLSLSALLVLSLLAACDGGNSSVINNNGDSEQPAGSGNGSQAVIDVSGPTIPIVTDTSLNDVLAGTRAQVYRGSFNHGSGTFLLDENNRLIGLVTDSEGVEQSVRADIGAEGVASVSLFNHQSRRPSSGQEIYPFAENEELVSGVELEVVDGQRLGSLSDALPIELSAPAAGLLSISADSLQGAWTGSYLLCDALDQNCAQSILQFSVAGDQLSGSSQMLAADGTDLLPSDVTGQLTQRGRNLDVQFRWNTYVYEGLVFAEVANPQQISLMATTDSEIADERTLAFTLVRLQLSQP